MMPKSSLRWPLAGEIDILESSGHTPEKVLGAVHFGQLWPNNVHYSESILAPVPWTDDFHVYAVEWRPEEFAGLLTTKSTAESRQKTSRPILGCSMSCRFI